MTNLMDLCQVRALYFLNEKTFLEKFTFVVMTHTTLYGVSVVPNYIEHV